MIDLPLAEHAGVEGLAVIDIRPAVASVGVQEVAALVRQHDAPVVIADSHHLDVPFAEMVERVAHARSIVTTIGGYSASRQLTSNLAASWGTRQ